MSTKRAVWAITFYCSNYQEQLTIKTRAAMEGKSVSRYIRDLIMADLVLAKASGYSPPPPPSATIATTPVSEDIILPTADPDLEDIVGILGE